MNETLKRTLSGAVYIVLLIASILYSTESFFILFGALMLIAVVEFCDLVNLKKVFPIVSAILAYCAFYKLKFSRNDDLILLGTTLFVSIKAIFFLFSDKKLKADITTKYVYLIGYIILPMVLLTKIPFGEKGYNPKIIISIFILIWTNDTFAFIVGKSIGKHKLFEKISPKKTIEGFIGGIIFTIIAGYLISKFYFRPSEKYLEKSVLIWTIIAFIVSVFGTIGDLIESKFKRIAAVKDSGTIMPGHGGILDRLDSVIFVAPFVFLFYQILYYATFS